MIRTSNALVTLWLNAAFLPVAMAIDMVNASRPNRDQESGAPEGANVIELEERRKLMEQG